MEFYIWEDENFSRRKTLPMGGIRSRWKKQLCQSRCMPAEIGECEEITIFGFDNVEKIFEFGILRQIKKNDLTESNIDFHPIYF